MKNISIIGTGAYGLSVAISLLKKCDKIKMWVESEERAKFLTRTLSMRKHENSNDSSENDS